MQFALLIYQGTTPLPESDEWNALPKDQQKQIYADYAAINQNPAITPGVALGLPKDATTVRVENGATTTSGGAYLGIDGALGGYLVLEADDEAAAIAVAASIPAARLGGAIEVRPVATYW